VGDNRVHGRAAGEHSGVHRVGRSESKCIRRWGGTYRGVVGIAGSKVDDRVGEQAAEASGRAADESGRAADESGRAVDEVLVGLAGVPLTHSTKRERSSRQSSIDQTSSTNPMNRFRQGMYSK